MGKKNLVSFLKQPYPFYFEGKDLFYLCTVVFLMSLFFNYIFKPFDVYVPEQKMHYFWISAIHSIVPILVIALASAFIKLTRSLSDDWLLWKEFLLIFIILLLTGTGQFLVRDIIYDNPNNWSWLYFFEEVRNTCLVGMLFVAILISLNLNRLLIKNQRNALLMATGLDNENIKGSGDILISTQLKSDDFVLNPNTFLFAKADGNYVEVYYNNHESVQKFIKRIPIKNLEKQLQNIPFIVKTHRSYLVNINQIETISGNAQGYKLKLKRIDEIVPVSRYSISTFEKKMKAV